MYLLPRLSYREPIKYRLRAVVGCTPIDFSLISAACIANDKKTSDQHFTDALEYYNKALKMEMQLGPRGHSIEYEDVKTDLEALLKRRQADKSELEAYQRMFKVDLQTV